MRAVVGEGGRKEVEETKNRRALKMGRRRPGRELYLIRESGNITIYGKTTDNARPTTLYYGPKYTSAY